MEDAHHEGGSGYMARESVEGGITMMCAQLCGKQEDTKPSESLMCASARVPETVRHSCLGCFVAPSLAEAV